VITPIQGTNHSHPGQPAALPASVVAIGKPKMKSP
jgi:hypothetical protein